MSTTSSARVRGGSGKPSSGWPMHFKRVGYLRGEFLNATYFGPGRGYTPGVRRLAPEPPSSEITPESVYLRRREFLKNTALAAGTAAAFGSGLVWLGGQRAPPPAADLSPSARPFTARRRTRGRVNCPRPVRRRRADDALHVGDHVQQL